VLEIGNSLSA